MARGLEADLLALQDRYAWAAGDDEERERITATYRETHAKWIANRRPAPEPREPEPVQGGLF